MKINSSIKLPSQFVCIRREINILPNFIFDMLWYSVTVKIHENNTCNVKIYISDSRQYKKDIKSLFAYFQEQDFVY